MAIVTNNERKLCVNETPGSEENGRLCQRILYNPHFYGYNIIRMYFSAETAGFSKEGPARAMSKQKKKAALSREDEMTGAKLFGKHASVEKRRALLAVTLAACAMPMLLGWRFWSEIPRVVETGLIGPGGQDDSLPRWMVAFGMPAFMCLMDAITHMQLHLNQKRMTIPAAPVRLLGRWGFPVLSVIFCSWLIFHSAGQKMLQLSFVTPCALGLLLLLLGSHMFDCPLDSRLALRFSGLEEKPLQWKAVHRFAGWIWMLAGLALIAWTMAVGSLSLVMPAVVLAAFAAPWIFARSRSGKMD